MSKKEKNVENKIINEYEVQLGPVDHLGHKWVMNLIRYIRMGAEVKEGTIIKATFPHYAWLTVSTEDILKNEPGVQVHCVSETYTKKQLEEMTWQEFRVVVGKKKIKGRDRRLMLREYLKVTGQLDNAPPVEEKEAEQDADAASKDKHIPEGGTEEVSEEAPSPKE